MRSWPLGLSERGIAITDSENGSCGCAESDPETRIDVVSSRLNEDAPLLVPRDSLWDIVTTGYQSKRRSKTPVSTETSPCPGNLLVRPATV
jgi:hypothetical protein